MLMLRKNERPLLGRRAVKHVRVVEGEQHADQQPRTEQGRAGKCIVNKAITDGQIF